MAPINLQSISEALKPGLPFGAPIRVKPETGPLPWTDAADYQRSILIDAVEKSRDTIPKFAVFSLSQIPLCIHLGFILSDRLDVRCYQFDRDERTWRWPNLHEDADPTMSVTGIPDLPHAELCEAIIRINLSAHISPPATREAAGKHPVQIDISVPSPDVMWLRSPKQLIKLGQTFRNVLSELRRLVPRCTRIHLFYAGPTGGAVVVGQQINPRMNPPIDLYEYSQQETPQHQRALTLQ